MRICAHIQGLLVGLKFRPPVCHFVVPWGWEVATTSRWAFRVGIWCTASALQPILGVHRTSVLGTRGCKPDWIPSYTCDPHQYIHKLLIFDARVGWVQNQPQNLAFPEFLMEAILRKPCDE